MVGMEPHRSIKKHSSNIEHPFYGSSYSITTLTHVGSRICLKWLGIFKMGTPWTKRLIKRYMTQNARPVLSFAGRASCDPLPVWGLGLVGPAFLAHAMQRVSNIVGLTALRLAFLMGYG